MTYLPNIPKVTESPKGSAPEIETNFDQIASRFSQLITGLFYNHIPFNDLHQGKHGVVLFQKQAADPGVTQDLAVLFNKTASAAAGDQPQLFVQIPQFLPTNLDSTTAPNIGMQLTYNTANTAGPIYQSFMVGGLLVFMGQATTGVQLTFTPTPKKILNVQVFGLSFISSLTLTQPDKIKVDPSLGPAITYNYLVIAQA